MAAELARELRVPIHVVEVRCSAEIAVARLARRERMGTDPSDAGPALYAQSVARFEPVTGEGNLHVIHTDVADWRDVTHELAREIA
jgi:predicted kinase